MRINFSFVCISSEISEAEDKKIRDVFLRLPGSGAHLEKLHGNLHGLCSVRVSQTDRIICRPVNCDGERTFHILHIMVDHKYDRIPNLLGCNLNSDPINYRKCKIFEHTQELRAYNVAEHSHQCPSRKATPLKVFDEKQQQVFKSLVGSSSRINIVHGLPGSGKSTIAQLLVCELLKNMQAEGGPAGIIYLAPNKRLVETQQRILKNLVRGELVDQPTQDIEELLQSVKFMTIDEFYELAIFDACIEEGDDITTQFPNVADKRGLHDVFKEIQLEKESDAALEKKMEIIFDRMEWTPKQRAIAKKTRELYLNKIESSHFETEHDFNHWVKANQQKISRKASTKPTERDIENMKMVFIQFWNEVEEVVAEDLAVKGIIDKYKFTEGLTTECIVYLFYSYMNYLQDQNKINPVKMPIPKLEGTRTLVVDEFQRIPLLWLKQLLKNAIRLEQGPTIYAFGDPMQNTQYNMSLRKVYSEFGSALGGDQKQLLSVSHLCACYRSSKVITRLTNEVIAQRHAMIGSQDGIETKIISMNAIPGNLWVLNEKDFLEGNSAMDFKARVLADPLFYWFFVRNDEEAKKVRELFPSDDLIVVNIKNIGDIAGIEVPYVVLMNPFKDLKEFQAPKEGADTSARAKDREAAKENMPSAMHCNELILKLTRATHGVTLLTTQKQSHQERSWCEMAKGCIQAPNEVAESEQCVLEPSSFRMPVSQLEILRQSLSMESSDRKQLVLICIKTIQHAEAFRNAAAEQRYCKVIMALYDAGCSLDDMTLKGILFSDNKKLAWYEELMQGLETGQVDFSCIPREFPATLSLNGRGDLLTCAFDAALVNQHALSYLQRQDEANALSLKEQAALNSLLLESFLKQPPGQTVAKKLQKVLSFMLSNPDCITDYVCDMVAENEAWLKYIPKTQALFTLMARSKYGRGLIKGFFISNEWEKMDPKALFDDHLTLIRYIAKNYPEELSEYWPKSTTLNAPSWSSFMIKNGKEMLCSEVGRVGETWLYMLSGNDSGIKIIGQMISCCDIDRVLSVNFRKIYKSPPALHGSAMLRCQHTTQGQALNKSWLQREKDVIKKNNADKAEKARKKKRGGVRRILTIDQAKLYGQLIQGLRSHSKARKGTPTSSEEIIVGLIYADLDEDEALARARKDGDDDVVLQLLSAGVRACKDGYDDVVLQLLSAGADGIPAHEILGRFLHGDLPDLTEIEDAVLEKVARILMEEGCQNRHAQKKINIIIKHLMKKEHAFTPPDWKNLIDNIFLLEPEDYAQLSAETLSTLYQADIINGQDLLTNTMIQVNFAEYRYQEWERGNGGKEGATNKQYAELIIQQLGELVDRMGEIISRAKLSDELDGLFLNHSAPNRLIAGGPGIINLFLKKGIAIGKTGLVFMGLSSRIFPDEDHLALDIPSKLIYELLLINPQSIAETLRDLDLLPDTYPDNLSHKMSSAWELSLLWYLADFLEDPKSAKSCDKYNAEARRQKFKLLKEPGKDIKARDNTTFLKEALARLANGESKEDIIRDHKDQKEKADCEVTLPRVVNDADRPPRPATLPYRGGCYEGNAPPDISDSLSKPENKKTSVSAQLDVHGLFAHDAQEAQILGPNAFLPKGLLQEVKDWEAREVLQSSRAQKSLARELRRRTLDGSEKRDGGHAIRQLTGLMQVGLCRDYCLGWSCTEGHNDLAIILIGAGADINRSCQKGETALMKASCHGHNDVATTLLKASAEVNHRCNESGMTALAWAARNHDHILVDSLLEYGADPNMCDITGKPPLMQLFKKVDHTNRKSIVTCKLLVRMLLKKLADIEARDHRKLTVLQAAIDTDDKGDEDTKIFIEILLKENANINAEGYPPYPGPVDREFCEPCNIRTALMLAAEEGKPGCLRFLLEQRNPRAELNTVGDRRYDYPKDALRLAVYNEKETCIRLLVEAKADIEYEEKYGEFGASCLHLAIEYDLEDALRLLLELNANPNVHDCSGYTPLIQAAGLNHEECLITLLGAGALVNAIGEDVSAEDESSCHTALFNAASEGHANCVQRLLGAGADVNLRDKSGKCAIWYAENNASAGPGHKACVEILNKHSGSSFTSGNSDPGLTTITIPALCFAEDSDDGVLRSPDCPAPDPPRIKRSSARVWG